MKSKIVLVAFIFQCNCSTVRCSERSCILNLKRSKTVDYKSHGVTCLKGVHSEVPVSNAVTNSCVSNFASRLEIAIWPVCLYCVSCTRKKKEKKMNMHEQATKGMVCAFETRSTCMSVRLLVIWNPVVFAFSFTMLECVIIISRGCNRSRTC